MNSDKSKFRQVLVDVAEYDKDGNPIPFDSLSSGGARNAHGSLITQYKNPRLPEPASQPVVNREFDERMNRDDDARLRRQEAAEERRRERNAEFAMFVIDGYVIPFTKQVIVPRATELWETKGKPLWDTKVLPGGKRFAQRLLRAKMSQPEVPLVSEDTPDCPAETANPLKTYQHNTDHTDNISAVQDGAADTPLADVIQIDEYQDRRSA